MTPAKKKAPVDADRLIDLDAARAARAEVRAKDGRGDPPTVKVGGELYPLPPELPAEAVHAFGALMRGDVSGLALGMESIFGADAWARIRESQGEGFSIEDEIFLLETALDLYGIDLPNSEASAPSS